jgi:hypothetical protein
MSLVTNIDNIYIVNPNSKYADEESNWSSFMESDFTIFLRSKIFVYKMKNGEYSFMISRNGKHAGLSTMKDEQNNIHVVLTYWFWQKNPEDENNPIPIQKTLSHCLQLEQQDKFNDYSILCDHKNSKITFYINDLFIGEIDYSGMDKCSYKEAYMWFGCGNMVTETMDHRYVGDYEFDLFFCLDKLITLEDVIDLSENYESKYIDDYFDLKILKKNTPYRNNIFFFLDFKEKNTFKIWNLSFNGHYPNFYIKDNTTF